MTPTIQKEPIFQAGLKANSLLVKYLSFARNNRESWSLIQQGGNGQKMWSRVQFIGPISIFHRKDTKYHFALSSENSFGILVCGQG